MIGKLIKEIQKKNAPIVVGLDPTLKLIPGHILTQAINEQGETLEAAGEAIKAYNKGIVDAVCDLVPAVKPQIAMYEQFGLPGLEAFKWTIDYCHSKGLVVIGDIKRGDIGSTSEAYAAGHIGKVTIGGAQIAPFDEDIVTVNPYLGSDGIRPFVKVATENDKGIFVLVKTSNPSSGELQDRYMLRSCDKTAIEAATASAFANAGALSAIMLQETRPMYEVVGDMVGAAGAEYIDPETGYSEIGAVVGATYPEQGKILRKLMPKAYILVPGYGAQGGKGADLVHFFNSDGLGAIINSSRGIIGAYKQEAYASYGEEGYADAARTAVLDMKADIEQALGERR